MSAGWRVAGTVLAIAIGVACSRSQPTPASRETTPVAKDAASATYIGMEGGPVTLANGLWEGEPAPGGQSRARVELVRDFMVRGDLDGDGELEEVVLLSRSSGGSGTFDWFAVLARRGGGVVNIATAPLGDRVQVVNAAIDNGQLTATVVRAGPNDAMCCPTEKARVAFAFQDGQFAKAKDEVIGTASIADIGGTEWRLSRFTWTEPAPPEPTVTLQLEGSHFVGRGGCNRYMAPVTAGDTPGTLTVGAPAGTRMACPPPADVVERRFFEALGSVDHYGFVAGQLALMYKTKDGALETMIFRRSDG